MSEFVQRRGEERIYAEFLQRKIEIARAEIRAGEGIPAGEVEAEFAARRAELLRLADEGNA